MRDRAVPLIAGHVAQFGAERFAPGHGIAAIAGMAEIHGAAHFGNVPRHKIGRAAVPVASQNQRLATHRVPRSVGPRDLDAANRFRGVGVKRRRGGVRDDDNSGIIDRLAQPVDQFGARAAGQAVHAPRCVAGIIEIVHHRKRQTIAVRQPLDGRAGLFGDERDDRAVGFAVRFGLDVRGEPFGAVVDAPHLLKTGAGRRNEARRQGRRAARDRVAFQHNDLGAGLVRRQRRAQSGGAGADDDNRYARGKTVGRHLFDAHAVGSA